MKSLMRGALAAVFLGLSAASFAQVEDAPANYPDGPHRDDTYYFCVACHSFQIVARQGMNRERWDETLTWMSERHAMPVLEGQQRQEVLEYLAKAFPEPVQTGRPGWRNPFAGQ